MLNKYFVCAKRNTIYNRSNIWIQYWPTQNVNIFLYKENMANI